ncbi:MAG TPA: transglutaminase domain-containing protein [Ignavibacteria bacterium]|nr:transglutaminase domain-containing protein [Ignavibacteria bacterium]
MDKMDLEQLNSSLAEVIKISKSCNEINPADCLQDDEIINHSQNDINTIVSSLTEGVNDTWNTVKRLFEFVRDRIIYDFAPEIEGPEDWQASTILKRGSGFCHQKAILLTAFLRASRLPAALVFQNVVDHVILNSRYEKLLPNGRLPLHALVAVNINDKWYRLDATLDAELCRKKAYRLTKVIPGEETLLPKLTLKGNPHFIIESELGYFESYPREFRDLLLKNWNEWNLWQAYVRKKHLTM